MEEKLTEQELIRRGKLLKLEEMGVAPFGQKFNVTHSTDDIKKYIDLTKEELDANPIAATIAGRIMLNRPKGKIGFFHVQDKCGKLQCLISLNGVGEEQYAVYKIADIGDDTWQYHSYLQVVYRVYRLIKMPFLYLFAWVTTRLLQLLHDIF